VTDSFVKRRVEIAVKLAPRTGTNQPTTFVESGTDTVTLAGFRTSVKVQNSGSAAGSQASVSIWGMSPSLMNQLSTLGMVVSIIPRNTMTIAAGDEGGSMTTVFVGTIRDAYGDYAGAPQVPFRFECYSGAAEQVIPFPASSYDGTTDVATMLSAIARRIGWGFENNSVNVKLVSPYLSGSAIATGRDHLRSSSDQLCSPEQRALHLAAQRRAQQSRRHSADLEDDRDDRLSQLHATGHHGAYAVQSIRHVRKFGQGPERSVYNRGVAANSIR
jgi:hypothetical protein